MYPLRAYGGYPTLVCHLGLKNMQRLGPDGRKTFYVTAPVASQSSGPQVVAISKKEIIFAPRCPTSIRGIMTMIIRLTLAMEVWRACTILGPKMAHPMAQEWTRKAVAVAKYLRASFLRPRTNQRIRMIRPTTNYLCLPANRHLLCPWSLS